MKSGTSHTRSEILHVEFHVWSGCCISILYAFISFKAGMRLSCELRNLILSAPFVFSVLFHAQDRANFQCLKILNPKLYSKDAFDFIQNLQLPKITRCTVHVYLGTMLSVGRSSGEHPS